MLLTASPQYLGEVYTELTLGSGSGRSVTIVSGLPILGTLVLLVNVPALTTVSMTASAASAAALASGL